MTRQTRPARILRLEDRQTRTIRYTLDRGDIQLLGPWYETRVEAETALRADQDPRTQ